MCDSFRLLFFFFFLKTDRQTDKSATMPPSHKLGDVTSLLSVKVRPRLNKGLNHCQKLNAQISLSRSI